MTAAPPPDPEPLPVPIGEYAVLGDGRTAALVSRRGSVDWLCLPALDSPACFARLLGGTEHGRWLLTVPDAHTVTRRWLGDSFVLETTYVAAGGTAVVTEAMPDGDDRGELVRRVVCTAGEVRVRHEWVVRFGYGTIEPWVTREHDGVPGILAVAGPDAVLLRGTRLPSGHGRLHDDEFTLRVGESFEATMTWTPSWAPTPAALPVVERIEQTRADWQDWVRAAGYAGPFRDAVTRSLLVLRLLTSAETGGIAAAATTSLPENPGGQRNWDYRYCWLRDAAMTLSALLENGIVEEATRWRDWLLRAVAGDPADLQIVYRLDGGRELPERDLGLPGWAGSRPVRVGNAAAGQLQNDVLGEVMCALDLARACGVTETRDSWSLQRHLVDDQLRRWRRPDAGIWEMRGEPRRFVHSAVMTWAAVDRAIRAVERDGLPGPVEDWRAARATIHADVIAHGYDPVRRMFVQSYGARHTDAALLQLVQVGFLPPDDERLATTVDAVRAELEVAPGLLLRYRVERAADGLPGGEHPFLACSCWLADALARTGRTAEAEQVLGVVCGLADDLGLLAEEYDPVGRRMIGNVPQALSHLALVRAAHQLALRSGHR